MTSAVSDKVTGRWTCEQTNQRNPNFCWVVLGGGGKPAESIDIKRGPSSSPPSITPPPSPFPLRLFGFTRKISKALSQKHWEIDSKKIPARRRHGLAPWMGVGGGGGCVVLFYCVNTIRKPDKFSKEVPGVLYCNILITIMYCTLYRLCRDGNTSLRVVVFFLLCYCSLL